MVACFSSLDGFSGGDDEGAAGEAGSPASGDSGAALAVRCPTDRCSADAPVCCAVLRDGSSASRDLVCRATGACGDGITVRCRSPEHCAAAGSPDAVCCMFRKSGGGMASIDCVAPSLCVAPHSVLCDRQAPVCAAGKICVPDPTKWTEEIDVCAPPP
jgi:hypothetical protein